MRRMHDDLPPRSLEHAVVFHQSYLPYDPAKALEHFRRCREMLDDFAPRWELQSGLAVSHGHADKRTIGETVGTVYWMVAMANRLDFIIAKLEKDVR